MMALAVEVEDQMMMGMAGEAGVVAEQPLWAEEALHEYSVVVKEEHYCGLAEAVEVEVRRGLNEMAFVPLSAVMVVVVQLGSLVFLD